MIHLDPEAAYRQISALVTTMPNLRSVTDDYSVPPETQLWLGRVHALLSRMGMHTEAVAVSTYSTRLNGRDAAGARDQITSALYRGLAAAELRAPAAVQGSFIAAGDQFDAFSALGKVLSQATGDVVMVDPYMDEVTLTDFLPLVSEGVSIRLLSDAHSVKPTLKPAVGKWQQQYGDVRPLSAKLSAPRSLHDRLIILDSSSAWILTQSLKDFAARSPGSIAKVDAEAASLKVRAYEAMWTSATDL
jgi:hypothetical protein